MNFEREQAGAVRAQARDFLARHLTAEVVERVHETGSAHDWGFYRALAAEGWLTASWPRRYGGQEWSIWEQAAFIEELYAAGAPYTTINTTLIVAHTLIQVGTDEQKERYLPAIARGEVLIALAYSEPEAGSDLASVRTKAEPDGDGWRINGQKQFTTGAENATHVVLLARTDPAAPKHGGLTTFLVPTASPGFDVTPMPTLGGERTNTTYYHDVAVADHDRVGDVNGGWGVMGVALPAERAAVGLGPLERMYAEARRWAASPAEGRRPGDDPAVRVTLAQVAIDIELTKLLHAASLAATEAGRTPLVEGSMVKLFASEAFTRAAGELFDRLGADALRELPGHPPSGTSHTEYGYRLCPVTTIAGGTSELQRTIIARHGLGLPVR